MLKFTRQIRKNRILDRMIMVVLPLLIASCAEVSFAGLPWNNSKWDRTLLEHIERSITDFDLAKDDMRRFCPKYLALDQKARVQAWGHLMVAIAKFESGYNPKSRMTESTGQDSIGLFQLSYGDLFCPDSKRQGDLTDAFVNISCAVKLAAHFVSKDKLVARGGYVAHGAASPKGMARYWSVIRTDTKVRKHKLQSIQEIGRAHV